MKPSIVREIDSPGVSTMFDTHNAIDEVEPHAVLLDRHYDLIRHVHVQRAGRPPLWRGNLRFQSHVERAAPAQFPRLGVLEAFDFTPGAEKLANDSIRYLESEIAHLPQ
jgi:sugar phosphate isomerase/epimerase